MPGLLAGTTPPPLRPPLLPRTAAAAHLTLPLPGPAAQVAEDGEIVWVFPRGFQDTIRSKSLLLRLEPAAKGAPGGPGTRSRQGGVPTPAPAPRLSLAVGRTRGFVTLRDH